MDTNDPFTDTAKTDNALSVLKDVDKYKNLDKATAALVFVTSAAIGVLAFFFTLDLTKWFGMDVEEPWMQISIPYVLTFIVWIVAYFSIQSALEMLGFRGLYVLSNNRLSELNLSLVELGQLHRDINDGELKHNKLFKAVIKDMESHGNL